MRTFALTAALAGGLSSLAAAASVEAGTLTTVTAEAPLYDPRQSDEYGCSPSGCVAGLTRDGDMATQDNRWSCKPSLGPTDSLCSITYSLADSLDIVGLNLAMYKGDMRTRTVGIYVDGVRATTWTSSGLTTDFESVMLGVNGKTVELRGVLEESEWLSIMEVEILADDGADDTSNIVQASALTPVTTSALLYDQRLAAGNGCDPNGCTASNTQDGEMADMSRWSCAPKLGDSEATACSIRYTLETAFALSELRLALYKGTRRQRTVQVYVDGDMVTTWTSSGTTDGFESIGLTGAAGTAIDIVGVLDESEWLSIIETEIMVYRNDVVTSPPSPTTPEPSATPSPTTEEPTEKPNPATPEPSATPSPTTEEPAATPNPATPEPAATPSPSTEEPAATPSPSTEEPAATPSPSTVQPVSPPSPGPGGNLQPVGLLPLVGGREPVLERFALKDGDLSTSWSCTGDAREPNDSGEIYCECEITLRLLHYRNIKQVKIALADGAERSTDMRITGRSDTAEMFVTSSGTTKDLETYDYNSKTDSISIAGAFSGAGETISISEVELVEEVVEGEVLIDGFNTPYDNGDGLWERPAVPGFAWTSESDEAIGRTLSFGLAGYFAVTEAQFQFPVGDTYKFDLEIFNELDGTGESYVTVPDLESVDQEGWQSFDLTSFADQPVSLISIVIKGTGSGAPGFKILDANFLGEEAILPSDGTITVGSTRIEYWPRGPYPDFVAEGTSDQHVINAAICAVKKATYDGIDCVGGDDAATGTVVLADDGYYMVDGSVVMKSGVFLQGYYNEDNGIQTYIALEEKAAGNTDMEAIVVMDGISDAWMDELWIRGQYDPETDDGSSGLGPACVSIQNSQNITARLLDAQFCEGDVIVVRNSDVVNIDAGRYDEELLAWSAALSRGTGMIVDSSDDVWVRRHTFYDNGVAGLHISGSNNFTFEATFDGYEDNSIGNVGSLNGQQPIEVIIESSTLVKFTDMRVQSANDPVMTISDSTGVSFTNLGLGTVPAGTCVIETDDPSTVAVDAEEDELELQDTCYVKV